MSQLKSAGMFSGHVSEGLVLIVDDAPDIRTVVRMTLEKAGYHVLEAEDGMQAIEEIRKGEHAVTLDVIITDICMPNMNGIDVIEYFRKEWPNVPLVVLTGFPDIDMATGLLQYGVADYLVKPVEGGKLRSAVSKAMNQRRLHSFV